MRNGMRTSTICSRHNPDSFPIPVLSHFRDPELNDTQDGMDEQFQKRSGLWGIRPVLVARPDKRARVLLLVVGWRLSYDLGGNVVEMAAC